MRQHGLTAILLAGLLSAGWLAWSREPDRGGKKPVDRPAPAGVVERGEYLVRHVAKCTVCHTPRDDKGQLDQARLLQGAPIWIRPVIKSDEWAERTPDLTASGKAGKWKEEKMVKLLTRGSHEANPPMPSFSMTAEDARAVYAYLRSLPGRSGR